MIITRILAREVQHNTLEAHIVCAIVSDHHTFCQNLFFISIHFRYNFPTMQGKLFQQLRPLFNVSDHRQLFLSTVGNAILRQIYNAASKPIPNI